MKKLFLLFTVFALTGIFCTINAQSKSGLSDKDLSAQYKQEIDVLSAEIKTIKVKLKADSANSDLKNELAAKEAELKVVKANKKVVDNAIKSKAASEKAQKNAEKAQKKADKAADDAKKANDAKRVKGN